MSQTERQQLNQLVDHLFRHEAGKMVAVISRIFGISEMELAEDILQDTLMEALHRWSTHPVPDNPAAWLMQVAKHKTVNELKRRQMTQRHAPELARRLEVNATTIDQAFMEDGIKDSQLRMIFTCCHPGLPLESQIALTLKSLCGFSVKEIAHALLTTTANINKRLYRARERFRDHSIAFEIPAPGQLSQRLDAVYLSLYLLFNEGYHASNSDDLIRWDICMEAIRLARLLADAFSDQPKIPALLSLMFLHAARFEARMDVNGAIVLLEDQDRSRWDQQLIATGLRYLKQAATGSVLSGYHLEAGIAATHCLAPNLEATNWDYISCQYALLSEIKPHPIIEFNRALILRWTEGPAAALQRLLALQAKGSLKSYHLLPAGIGAMQIQLGQHKKARASFLEAKTLTDSLPQLAFLDRKIQECDAALS